MANNYINAELSDFLIQQSTVIEILPNFEQDQLNFISGNFGPFKINQVMKVPMWLGLHLKKTNKCRIIQPQWLQVDKLKEAYQLEKNNDSELGNLVPQNYYEIAKILFANCNDDLQEDEQLKRLIEDISIYRQSKVKRKVEEFIKSQSEIMKINHISQHERNKAQNSGYQFMRIIREQITEPKG